MSRPLLVAEGLKVAFQGVKAADGVDLSIAEGERLAIIGPNGSGKTTFLNLCTGYVRPLAGEVRLDGRDITRMKPRRIARLGIARAFQIPQLFSDQRLVDNLMLSIAARRGPWRGLSPLDAPDARAEAMEILSLFGLSGHAEAVAATLPEGLRKLADITLALALRPRLLLLDEPTSGVSATERFEIMDTLMAALDETGVTALFVEHDMEVVRRYADRVLVWDAGRVLAEGPPAAVLRDRTVLERVVGMA